MSSLKKQFIIGVMYTAGAKYIGILIQLIITAILSRLLSPDDFGVVAIATVFIMFFNLLGDSGIGVGIVQNKELGQDDIEQIFTISIYMGIVLSVLFFSFSSAIANFYSNPVLRPICQILAVNILFSSFNVVLNALLLREKKFKFIAGRTIAIQVISGAMGIIIAYIQRNVYALIVYNLTASILLFLINYYRNPLPFRWSINFTSLKKILNYSIFQFLFNLINFFSRNLDKLIIGKFLGPVPLGYYDRAYRLMLLPVENLTYVLSPVIHPVFSEFQNDKARIFDSYCRIVKILAIVGFPLSVFLYFSSAELIVLFFGNQWEAAIPPFRILAWSIGFQIVLSSSGAIFQAANNTKVLFITGLLSALIIITGICYGIFWAKSLEGVASGLLLAFLINFAQCFLILINTLKGNHWTFLKLFRTPLVLSIFVAVSQWLYNYYIDVSSPLVSIIIRILIGGIAMLAGLFAFGDSKAIVQFVMSSFKK